MTSKFLSLNPEKQERILNAALKEFAQKGYENASTNEIVKSAGISKGLLFHYFNNKKELYLFLYNHFTEVISEEFFQELDFSERDIFERLKNLMILKSRLMARHPEIFDFMMSASMESSEDVKESLNNTTTELMQDSYSKLFDNIDLEKFRDGTDIQRTINIIMWTLQGFSNQELEKAKRLNKGLDDFEEAFQEAEVYIDMMKKAFYRSE
ncbi:TetR/AcrR family transcriptional regulator [Bacillus sp. ISL-35]|uniref:TetR/AcrR family transcriptional regulator n=1 Tax=Bacillus sp. ISL-35 TaxID=2819122 RepID=UPI001BE95A2D|nr:TetR/AcrR family transcriptional regulator [Bacillus sp. ISL-35]MBT2679953.1 TetR/AcrR family transcriptional regulator [Bacillus sp. ISL-35]MBT2703072.1 TetR/AcrR family transcriptional regulator [Chryseobacterium sp. ISL-80]